MSANIFNERFYSLREPAWHGLGKVSEQELGAQEAFGLLTPYDLTMEEVKTVTGLDVGLRAIVREPVPDDPDRVVFGTVGKEYELITPQQICEVFDRAVGAPVETVGALGRGETFFVTTEMPQSKIVGDVVKNFLLVDAPMAGNEALMIRLTPVRTVCQNTLIASRQRTVQSFRIRHDKDAIVRYEEWLGLAYGKAKENLKLLEQFFGAFAKTKVSDAQVADVLSVTYPLPAMPRRDAPTDIYNARIERYEAAIEYQKHSQTLAEELFRGAGQGSTTKAAAGTFWGLYNSVVELEDYRGAGHGGKNSQARQRDALFGWRADNKERCFDAIVDTLDLKG